MKVKIDLDKKGQIGFFDQIDLVGMIFTNSYVTGDQIKENVQIEDLVTVLDLEPFSGGICFAVGSTESQPIHHHHYLPHEEDYTKMTSIASSVPSDDDDSSISGDGLPDFQTLGWDIQNREDRRAGTDQMEDRRFREFFGASLLVVETVWKMLEKDSLLPGGCHPKHLLWALHFMKVYPKQAQACAIVGASAGAVDPKTHHNWVWAFIGAIAGLEYDVVST